MFVPAFRSKTLLTLPPDVPSALNDLVDLSSEIGGELIVFRPDDVIAYVSPSASQRYAFCNFSDGLTYAGLYWSAIEHGLVKPEDLRLTPEDYLHLALGVRRTNDLLDFQKKYRKAHFLCHHRRLPDGWTAQLRMDLDTVRVPGDAPLSVFDAIERTRETARLASALNNLPVGVLFTDAGGRVRWKNEAAACLMSDGDGIGERARHLRFDDEDVSAAFFQAIDDVLSGGTTSYVAVPHRGQHRLLSVTAAPYPGEAMVFVAPDDPTDSQVDVALAALGLSRTERRIAASIGRGENPKSISAITGQAVNTIRCHLVNTYRKLSLNMDVTTQRDLARLVGQVTSIAGFSRKNFH